MPGFNRMGPLNQGPMTGRGLGPCGGGRAYGRRTGRGMGRGLGLGIGFRFRQPTKSDDINDTKAYIEDLEAELEDAQGYLKGLQSNKQ